MSVVLPLYRLVPYFRYTTGCSLLSPPKLASPQLSSHRLKPPRRSSRWDGRDATFRSRCSGRPPLCMVMRAWANTSSVYRRHSSRPTNCIQSPNHLISLFTFSRCNGSVTNRMGGFLGRGGGGAPHCSTGLINVGLINVGDSRYELKKLDLGVSEN